MTQAFKQPFRRKLLPALIGSSLALTLLAGCAGGYSSSNPAIGKVLRSSKKAELEKLEAAQKEKQNQQQASSEENQKEAIDNYRAYIAMLPEGPAKRQAQRRLADLLVAQGNTQPETANSRFDQGPGDGLDGAAGPTTLYQDLLTSEAEEGEDKATILYQLARAYLNDGKHDKAVASLRQLANDYPDSPLVAEANLRRGELQFIRKNFKDAEQAYQAVIDDPAATSFNEQALYKLGWTHYKLEQFDLAVDTLHKLLEPRIPQQEPQLQDTQLDPQLTNLSRAKRELVQDGLSVTTMALAELQKNTSLGDYLAQRPPRHYQSLLYARLGELNMEREQYRQASEVWGEFIDKHPNHPHAPLFSSYVIDAWAATGIVQKHVDSKAAYAKNYAPSANFWVAQYPNSESLERRQRAELEATPIVRQARDYSREIAQHYHAQSQRPELADKRKQLVNQASSWYQHYLNEYPEQDGTAKINYLYAELLYENARWEDAAQQYSQSAYARSKHDKSADAAYGAVQAWRKRKEQLLASDSSNKTAIQAAAQEQVEASIKLADNYADKPEVATSLVAAIEELYQLGDLDRTIAIAQRVTSMQPAPNKSLLRDSWLMAAQAQADKKNHAQAETAWKNTLSLSKELEPNNHQKHANYRESLAAAIYHQAEASQNAGQLQAAVDGYLRVVTETPLASIASTAHFDAANTLLQMEKWDAAIPVLEEIRDRYPRDKRQSDIDKQLATAYLAINQPEKAAEEFARIGMRSSEAPETRREALWRSAELYDKAENDKNSDLAWQRYVANFPKPLEPAAEAQQRLIELARKRGDIVAEQRWQHRLVSADISGGDDSSERSRYLASRAARDLAIRSTERFQKAKISQPLKRSLEYKKATLSEAKRAWERVQKYRFEDQASEAQYQLAELQANIAESLLQSEKPAGLSELAQEEYDLLLEEQVLPFEEAAIEQHQAVVELLMEKDILDTWVRRSVDRLGEIYPAQWSQTERGVRYVEAE